MEQAAVNRIFGFLIVAVVSLSAPLAHVASANPSACPPISYGQVWTAGQWNACLASIQGPLGYTPVNKAGDTMLGPMITAPSNTTVAGFNLPQGAAPSAPNNGDMWMTSSGFFFRAGGVTVGPISTSSFVNQSANTVFAGPASGGAAAPAFRALVAADIPLFGSSSAGAAPASGGGTANFLRADGTWNAPVGTTAANPSATAGATAVNGSATTFMRSDAAPAVAKGSSSVFGVVEVDNSTITATTGVISAAQQVPSGAVVSYAGGSAPTGWFLMFGECESKTTYANLYAAIGDTWTSGDGCSTGNFGIPDARGRSIFGVDAMGGTPANRLGSGSTGGITGTAALGASGGQQSHTLTTTEIPVITPTGTISGQHGSDDFLTSGGGNATLANPSSGSSIGDSNMTLTMDSFGGGAAHNITPPALVLNYIIKQ
jgi:microcystin-dependent protein